MERSVQVSQVNKKPTEKFLFSCSILQIITSICTIIPWSTYIHYTLHSRSAITSPAQTNGSNKDSSLTMSEQPATSLYSVLFSNSSLFSPFPSLPSRPIILSWFSILHSPFALFLIFTLILLLYFLTPPLSQWCLLVVLSAVSLRLHGPSVRLLLPVARDRF